MLMPGAILEHFVNPRVGHERGGRRFHLDRPLRLRAAVVDDEYFDLLPKVGGIAAPDAVLLRQHRGVAIVGHHDREDRLIHGRLTHHTAASSSVTASPKASLTACFTPVS